MRERFSILLAALLMLQPALMARAEGGQSSDSVDNSQTAAIRQQVETAGVGSQVEVKLLDNNKIRGQLISIGTEDFRVKTGEDPNSVVHAVRFKDVKSIKFLQQPAAASANPNRSKITRRGKIMLVVGLSALIFGVVTYATTKGP
jgi:hypothetical protein